MKVTLNMNLSTYRLIILRLFQGTRDKLPLKYASQVFQCRLFCTFSFFDASCSRILYGRWVCVRLTDYDVLKTAVHDNRLRQQSLPAALWRAASDARQVSLLVAMATSPTARPVAAAAVLCGDDKWMTSRDEKCHEQKSAPSHGRGPLKASSAPANGVAANRPYHRAICRPSSISDRHGYYSR